MARVPSTPLLRFLQACISDRPFVCRQCIRATRLQQQLHTIHLRKLHTTSSRTQETIVPLRKQLKDEARARKNAAKDSLASVLPTNPSQNDDTTIDPALLSQYELTVGLELHVELSTSHKLFSPATTPPSDSISSTIPNTHVAPFDLALPGTQPQFQKATLLPALRAALALDCDIQRRSSWDRKHYFWWDQPAGYQITQYYEPFALNGHVSLSPSDLSQSSNSSQPHKIITTKSKNQHNASTPSQTQKDDPIIIPLKQIQIEQDTAKTLLQPPSTHLLDFNRVSHPLIEIITQPTIHSAEVAAAFVRKVQGILKAVGALERGMESGGLRVDVNVSVRKRDQDQTSSSSSTTTIPTNRSKGYEQFSNLGQRTEIKNLSSIAAVADAITAERNRQIKLLSSGGVVAGETRGWTLGAKATHRIRGKEGEVDYRYMPDPDLGPLLIGEDLIDWVREGLPILPETLINELEGRWGVSGKDARTLVGLDEGARIEWWFDVVEALILSLAKREDGIEVDEVGMEVEKKAGLKVEMRRAPRDEAVWNRVEELMPGSADGRSSGLISVPGSGSGESTIVMLPEISQEDAELKRRVGKLVTNWVLHETGALLTASSMSFDPDTVDAATLAEILLLLYRGEITLPSAKMIYSAAFRGEVGGYWRDRSGFVVAEFVLDGDWEKQVAEEPGSWIPSVQQFVEQKNLRLVQLSEEEYVALAEEVAKENAKMVEVVRKELSASASRDADAKAMKGGAAKGGKIMWFVGQMMRRGEVGRVQPERAEEAVRRVLLGS